DASGNTATCTFTILAAADTENPVITTCLTDQVVACKTTVIADYTGLVTATDNMDPSPIVTQIPAAGSAFSNGMTVTVTVTDASGNSADCAFKINTATDTEKPVFSTCVGTQIFSAGDAIPNFTALATVTDNCDATPSITQSPAAGTIFDGTPQTVTLTA